MNTQNNYNEEIDLLHMIYFVLSKWKLLFIVGAIGIVLGAGYGGFDAYKAYKASLEPPVAVDGQAPVEAPEFTTEDAVKSIAKFAIVGFVLGGIADAGVWACVYLFGGKLYTVTDIEGRFGIKHLGSIYNDSDLKGKDLWLAQQLHGTYGKLSSKEQEDFTLLNIVNELNKNDSITNILFLGTCKEKFEDTLKEYGYNVKHLDTVFGNVKGLLDTVEYDTVILVADNQKISIKDMDVEISVLKDYSKSILGIVVVE